jgi:Uma2 family endonuclease
MSIHEIVLPETKPETEWVRGRPLQKVSPTYSHGRLQALVAAALGDWADSGEHGRVATEWRFRVTPAGRPTRPLVPDVGFLSYEVLGSDVPLEDVQLPLAAPTVAVEILSPDDRRVDIDDKIGTYLASGSALVILIDPRAQRVELHDVHGLRELGTGDILAHDALPGFALELGALFRRAAR